MLINILTSAAVATVVSALISQIGLFFERKQKKELSENARRELLFTKAIELALSDRDFELEIAKATKKGGAIIPPPAVTVTNYFEYLNHIYKEGTVPDEVIQTLQKQVDEHSARLGFKKNEQP